MAKSLGDVFPQLELNHDLAKLFAAAQVERVTTNSTRTLIRVHLTSDRLLAKPSLDALEHEIRQQVFSDQNIDVEIRERFLLSDTYTMPQLVEAYWDSVLEECHKKSLVEYNLLRTADRECPDEDSLIVILDDTFVAHQREEEIYRFLSQIFLARCGREANVTIRFREHVLPERKEEVRIEEMEGAAVRTEPSDQSDTIPLSNSTKKSSSRHTKSNKSGGKDYDLIYGRDFTGEPSPIDQLAGEVGEVVIQGQVIATDEHEIRDGKTIYKFILTDRTDSIAVKIFLKNDKLPLFREKVGVGSFVILRGLANIDNFERDLAIGSVSGIAAVPPLFHARTDDASEKRVELHCHTKMSDMDGVSDVKDIIRRAKEWGHRAIAITDHGDVQAFTDASALVGPDDDFKVIYGMEAYLVNDMDAPDADVNTTKGMKKLPSYHTILLAQNDIGRVNLYKLVSDSHLKYFYRRPRVPKSELLKHREGILVGSACEAGELYRALVAGQPEEELERIADFYDYLEIQPVGNNAFMIREEKNPVTSEEDIRDLNRHVIALGERLDKPVVATCDVHFLDPEDEVYRRIIMYGKGFQDADYQAPLFLHTTEEMLSEFSYLGKEKAHEIVIENPNRIADMCERISAVRPDKCPPEIKNSDQMLREICYSRAHEIYGEELPQVVADRLERELSSIITHGFAVMYIIAQKLVSKSNEDGYLVGSRGSVGSSLVATMAGITEVNPLSPHYICPKCHFTDFDSPQVRAFAGRAGCDMPDRECPVCGTKLLKDGFDIPFETFLGFDGDKEPDIDLNFSGDYQSKAHRYTEVIFGDGQTYRAGTIGTMADKTAFGFVKNYFEDHELHKRGCEIDRIVSGCVGVRRSTGQHPGGIIVLPHGEEIYSFTPIQHPANDMSSDIVTTHFDYHSIEHNLLKLDILGHDDPTMVKMLQDLTGIDPRTIPLDSPEVMSLFQDTSALGITPEDINGCKLGALGVPEFGTDYAMQILQETHPKQFSDLVRIAGLSHGTDVWGGNAQVLLKEGKADISTAICTRDDIMTYLISMGMDKKESFNIMEHVRRGNVAKGKCSEWQEWKQDMLDHDIPEWYPESCERIQYMFPKAHAAAYVMMAWRIAYCKVFYPLEYYAAFFSIRATAFDYALMCQGRDHLEKVLADYLRRRDSLSQKEQDTLRDLRVVQEMYARGYEFVPLDLTLAQARNFRIIDGKLMPAINTIEGMGDKAAAAVEEAAKEGPFLSRDDFRDRTKVSKTVVDLMGELGLLQGLPETNQMSLFDL